MPPKPKRDAVTRAQEIIIERRANEAFAEITARATVVTTAEAAALGHCHPRTITRAWQRGELERVELDGDGRPFYRLRDVVTWIVSRGGTIVVLAVVVMLALLAIEMIDLIIPGTDFGFPPGTGHPAKRIIDLLDRLLL